MQKLQGAESLWHRNGLNKVGLRTDAVSACARDGTRKGHVAFIPNKLSRHSWLLRKKKAAENGVKNLCFSVSFHSCKHFI